MGYAAPPRPSKVEGAAEDDRRAGRAWKGKSVLGLPPPPHELPTRAVQLAMPLLPRHHARLPSVRDAIAAGHGSGCGPHRLDPSPRPPPRRGGAPEAGSDGISGSIPTQVASPTSQR